jgi:glycine betaine/proline transport system substrate-binding protein
MPIFDSQQPKPRRCQFFAVFLLGITSSILSYPLHSCDLVRIAINDSPTTQIVAHIDEAILRVAFNCDVVLTPSEIVSAPVFMVMAQETPDVVPLVWSDDLQLTDNSRARYTGAKKLGSVFQFGLRQGFWVPRYMSRALPKLATIEGVLSHPEFFPHPTNKTRGAFFGCPSTLNCGITSRQMYKAFAMAESGFEYVEPDSIDQLFQSLHEAYEKGNGWFGYLWEPTSALGEHDMARVDEGTDTNAVKWISQIQTVANADPERNRYPWLHADTYVTNGSELDALVLKYLTRRTFPADVFSHLLSWKEVKNASARETAQYFLRQYEVIWSNWVDFDSAGRVRNALMKEEDGASVLIP